MTVVNVSRVVNKIGDKWKVMDCLHIPEPLQEEIKSRYSTETEQIRASADYYVNCHPNASWEDLTWKLHNREEFAAARESKSFMSTGKYYLPYSGKVWRGLIWRFGEFGEGRQIKNSPIYIIACTPMALRTQIAKFKVR